MLRRREVVNEDVRADQVFDRVQYLWMMNDGIGPIEQEVRLRPFREIHLCAVAPFVCLQTGPECPNFCSGQHGHGAHEAVLAITPDLFCGRFFGILCENSAASANPAAAPLRRVRL